jgi:hypothetical protein
LDAETFEGQFTFVEAKGHFDIPAACISQDNGPGVIRSRDQFIGEQIPGFASGAWASNDEPEGVVMILVEALISNETRISDLF